MPTSPDKVNLCPPKCENLIAEVKSAPDKKLFMQDNMAEMEECIQLCTPPSQR